MITQSTMTEIAELTHDNHHTAALSVAARALNLDALAEQLEDLEADQEEAGELTKAMQDRRRVLSAELFSAAQQRLGMADYARFYRCF
jgi:hypothetical protein